MYYLFLFQNVLLYLKSNKHLDFINKMETSSSTTTNTQPLNNEQHNTFLNNIKHNNNFTINKL